MTDKILCEECGAEMVPIDPDKPIGMKCPECGWGWVTSYIEPKLEDVTVYSIFLEQGNEPGVESIKAVSKVANCNFIQAKQMIIGAPQRMAEGRAVDIERYVTLLNKASVKYYIEPEWTYEND